MTMNKNDVEALTQEIRAQQEGKNGIHGKGRNQSRILEYLRTETDARKLAGKHLWFGIVDVRKGCKITQHASTRSSLEGLVEAGYLVREDLEGRNFYKLAPSAAKKSE